MKHVSCLFLIFLLLLVSFTAIKFQPSWFPKLVYGTEATSNTVASSDNAEAIYHVAQPKIFYAATRWWMFLDNASSMVYVTSTDQVTWTPGLASPIHSGGLAVGPRFCVWYNGTHVIYDYTTGTFGDAMHYRIGVPQSDGNVSWSTDEEIAVAGIAGVGYNYGNLATASTGEVVLAYRKYTDALYLISIWVTIRPSYGGSWSAQVQLSTNGSGTHEMIPKVVPLTGGKVYVIWTQPGVGKTYGEMYYTTNSSWNIKEDVGISIPTTPFFPPSAVNQGDWIYYGARNSLDYLVFYKRENTWSFNSTIDYAPDPSNIPALCINTQTNCTYVFWLNSTQHVYYTIFNGTAFDNIHD